MVDALDGGGLNFNKNRTLSDLELNYIAMWMKEATRVSDLSPLLSWQNDVGAKHNYEIAKFLRVSRCYMHRGSKQCSRNI